ncbi:hypothetical protein BUALT_Bualt14G0023200 [Buddleja alternifolia]|uniref:Gem-associated protein 2 n=1 Tax=Buddleja alternifolia TaxID=168488 RepID=A0AAV6WG93_9LAMI|nr:hypothetical protein BUALT_Bualt14G0023200 [Buddleja alternifolia]
MADSSDTTDGSAAVAEIPRSLGDKQQSLNGSPQDNTLNAFDNSDENNGNNHTVVVVSGQEDGADAYEPQMQGPTTVNKQEGKQDQCSEKCALNIQLIDQTALIVPTTIAENGKFNNENDCAERNTKRQEKKEKKSKRRGGRARKNKDVLSCYSDEKKEKKGLQYSRKEMEALRFEELEYQKRKWVEVYCGLSPIVAQEYDGLLDDTDRVHQKHNNNVPSIDFDPRPQFRKSPNLGEDCFQFADSRAENVNTSNPAYCLPDGEEIGCSIVEEECGQDDDTDEDYSSIQRPAFLVTGEPDFDSGPPQDGLEYLRRVRWETARIPKVTVAKVNKMKEQSLYMPQIPGIMKCPDNLLPLKQWEDSFLADFAELRLVFSQLDLQNSSAETPTKVQCINKESIMGQMLKSIVFEKFNSTTSDNDSSPSEASSDAKAKHSQESSSLINDCPTLSTILKMEAAARNSMLKKRIRSIENMSTLARNDCLWLFALCVAVDCPLDADTSAALRSLLRKCACLRAAKTDVDDQVVVLNIFVTISGRYFGQLESYE